jgi:hypothetical protein
VPDDINDAVSVLVDKLDVAALDVEFAGVPVDRTDVVMLDVEFTELHLLPGAASEEQTRDEK